MEAFVQTCLGRAHHRVQDPNQLELGRTRNTSILEKKRQKQIFIDGLVSLRNILGDLWLLSYLIA